MRKESWLGRYRRLCSSIAKAVSGTVKIDSLDAYPLKFHPDKKGLCEAIMKQGKKWVSLIGVHHKQFDGIAALKCGDKLLRHNVDVFSALLMEWCNDPYFFC